MGSCMSKSQSKKIEFSKMPPPIPEERRRRLSVSQSANVSTDPGDERGTFHLNISEDSILNMFSGKRRFSLSGAPSQKYQCGFDDKTHVREGLTDTNIVEYGLGYSCKKGLKPESPNQDDFFIIQVDEWGLYGVFDGHGPDGHNISNFSQKNLPRILVTHPLFKTNPNQALSESFVKLHELIEETSSKYKKFDCQLSGTTATVILHVYATKQIHVAHVGDSRAILCSRTAKGIIAHDLTEDHKPELENETKRIVSKGGVVRRLDYDIPYRVFIKSKPLPGLAMSRALGDSIAHSVGVICIPDVKTYSINEYNDLFFLICSDGVWEFISSQEASDIIYEKKSVQTGDLISACEELAAESWRRWISVETNVVDDITVLYVDLQKKSTAKNSPIRSS